MIFNKVQFLNEEIEKFNTINHSNKHNNETKAQKALRQAYIKKNIDQAINTGRNFDRHSSSQSSLASGNIFESLANSDPQRFNREKLLQLKNSNNLVMEFNDYFIKLINIHNREFYNHDRKFFEDEHNNNMLAKEYNIAIAYGVQKDIEILANEGFSDGEITEAVFGKWVPQTLSEKGCRALIDIRLKNNKTLTDALTKMLKTNYAALGIGEAEASKLIKDLDDDSKNNEAIGKIKEFIQDPEKLDKFKIGPHTYDFRSIGGAVMFYSDSEDILFRNHPSKNLSRIFKYDAMVISHGGSRINTGGDIKSVKDLNINGDLLKNGSELLDKFYKFCKQHESYIFLFLKTNDLSDIYSNITRLRYNLEYGYTKIGIEIRDLITKLYRYIEKKSITPKQKEVYDIFIKFINDMKNLADEFDKMERSFYFNKENARKHFRNVESSEWITQPVDTLSTKQQTSMIKIIRTLKKEGFKNIYIASCNPKNVDLPKDIKNDKDFKVYMGHASVLQESQDDEYINLCNIENYLESLLDDEYIDYQFMTLNELYNEYDNLYNNQYVLNEGFLDKLKDFVKKAIQIIINIWKKIVEFFKSIYFKIRDFVTGRFGQKSNNKMKKQVEVQCICINGDKASTEKTSASTPQEIQNAVQKANNSINQYIQKKSREESEYIKKIENLINSQKIKSNKVNESVIFRNIKFL